MQRIYSLYMRGQHKRNLPASPMNTWWREQREPITHVIVDMTGAFIDGALACGHGQEAAQFTAEYVEANPQMRALYVCDRHPADHCSFAEYGGQWPAHAVEGTEECAISPLFYAVSRTVNTPIERYNVFAKGMDPQREEYSGFDARNEAYGALKFNLTGKVLVSGIAAEYCVKSTVADLLKNGFEVAVLTEGLGYVTREGADAALREMAEMGAELL